jgi:hypothetical protein
VDFLISLAPPAMHERSMNQEPPRTPAEKFHHLIDGLFGLVWRCIAFIGEPLAIRTLRHIRWHDRRFTAIAAKVAAGTYVPAHTRPPRPARPKPESTQPDTATPENPPPRPPPLPPLPRRKYWLCALLKHHATIHGGLMDMLVREPEMQALLAAAPQLWRHVRAILFICGGDLSVVPELPPHRRNQLTPEQARARRAKAARVRRARLKAERAALEPSARAYRRPRAGHCEPWMPHHPAQVRARLTGYYAPRPKKS